MTFWIIVGVIVWMVAGVISIRYSGIGDWLIMLADSSYGVPSWQFGLILLLVIILWPLTLMSKK